MIMQKKKTFKMSDRSYVGANPIYSKFIDDNGLVEFKKVASGIPFRRV